MTGNCWKSKQGVRAHKKPPPLRGGVDFSCGWSDSLMIHFFVFLHIILLHLLELILLLGGEHVVDLIMC
jgi:hypothetical protein